MTYRRGLGMTYRSGLLLICHGRNEVVVKYGVDNRNAGGGVEEDYMLLCRRGGGQTQTRLHVRAWGCFRNDSHMSMNTVDTKIQ
jgi:hypothetical protein